MTDSEENSSQFRGDVGSGKTTTYPCLPCFLSSAGTKVRARSDCLLCVPVTSPPLVRLFYQPRVSLLSAGSHVCLLTISCLPEVLSLEQRHKQLICSRNLIKTTGGGGNCPEKQTFHQKAHLLDDSACSSVYRAGPRS